MHFVGWWTAPPAIVAESLTAVSDPLLTALRPGPLASGAAVAASMARSLVAPEAQSPTPLWLLQGQQLSFRQTLAAVRRYRGAVLADAVGSGKTYVALAVAARFNRGPTACLIPATLLTQWKAVAHQLGIPVALCSHEHVSRGRLPHGTRGMVIIDESHHLRNRNTKRYSHLAQWLVGRPALFVTATPIVNRLADLGNQLRLAVRDNALAIAGVPSLRALFDSGQPHVALGDLVVENDPVADCRPRRVSKVRPPDPAECRAFADSVELISRLSLSRSESIASLVRGVLLKTAGSSPAALTGALQRYRRLLLHASDAYQAGRAMERSELRRFTAGLGDQLVWWELLPSNAAASDLDLTDLRVLESIIPAATAQMKAEDTKLNSLREILAENRPTLVFTVSRDTVRYIRERLSDLNLAWCTGDRAGIGSRQMPRSVVLGWFREGAPRECGPRHLVVTDVAAEGLDLQRAGRVVHYDLPWTPMRLEQREGRAVRLGSRHPDVEVVRFSPPSGLERSLHLEATLARKCSLPAAVGVGPGGRHIWRWRAELARDLGRDEAVAGVAHVSSLHQGLLAGFALYRPADPATCLSATVGWLELSGVWTEDAGVVSERLTQAAAAKQQQMVIAADLRQYLELLTPLIRNRLSDTRGRRWLSPETTAAARATAVRLGGLIRQAARLRQEGRLLQLERALGFVAGGHTAGEEMLLEKLAEAPDKDLTAALGRTLPQAAWDGIEVRLTGMIVFGANV